MRPLLFIAAICLAAAEPASAPLRSRVQLFKGSDEWQEVHTRYRIEPRKTAIVICDMWDKHWCRGASERVDALARKMEPVLVAAREAGVLVIHAPSDTMEFYKGYSQRSAVLNIARATPEKTAAVDAPPLPIDDSDGGCDTPGDKQFKAWTRQHPALSIAANDIISDNGEEIYAALKLRGITNLLVMGVHTNMCILNRSFAIKQMTRWGMRCILVRDLTDAMYDPSDRPFVGHDRGTELVVEHIEKYWAPSVLSKDLLAAFR